MIYIKIPEKAKVYHELYLTKDYEGRKSLKSKITKFKSYHIVRKCYCTIKEENLKKCAHEISEDIRDCFVQVYDFILEKFKDIVIGDLDTLYSIHQQYNQLIEKLFKCGEKFKTVDYKRGMNFYMQS